MARNPIFPPGTEMAEVRINLPKSKLTEIKELAVNAGTGPKDYIRTLLFRHVRDEAEKTNDRKSSS